MREGGRRWVGVLGLALLALLAACGGSRESAPPKPAPPPGPPAEVVAQAAALDAVLAAHRQVIVLMSDETGLPPADRPLAFVVGKLLFEGNLPRQAALKENLESEMTAASGAGFASPMPLTEAFLDALETEPSWHDADKLAFKETVSALCDHLSGLHPESPAGRAMAVRLDEDRKALAAIQALYDRELAKIFAQFQTRGMAVRREAWEGYLAYLRTLYTAQGVLEAHRAEVAGVVPPSEPPAGKALSGSSLPAKTLALTFDDGPHPKYTGRILDVLAKYKVKAVFYEVGQNIGRLDDKGGVKETASAAESKKILAAGCLVGNHTNTHPVLPKLADDQVKAELDDTTALIQKVDAVKPALFRPPYGALSASVRADVEAQGMRTMLWNIDSQDWADPVPTSVANRVIAEARKAGRGVILFHDIHDRAVDALPLVIETLQAEGFRFVLWDGETIVDRGAPEPVKAAPAPAPPPGPLYRESWAVVIGINEYAKWPRLSYAVHDALAVRDQLVNAFGFAPDHVFTLLDGDATRERILATLGDALSDPAKVSREDRVLVFFAGHGATRELPSGRSLGYIVPVDADPANLQSQCISMSNFQDIDDALPAKHVLYVMDACYSGLALTRSGQGGPRDPRRYLEEVTRRTARQMLTAGGAEEQVADNGPGGHSIFTWTVLQGLQGKADLNGDGFVTASELFSYAGPLVSSLSRQTPAFGNLVGSEGGDFVFGLKRGDEDLSELSGQLDDEAIRLNAQLDEARRRIAEKRDHNRALRKEVAQAEQELLAAGGAPSADTPTAKAAKASEEGLAFYRERRYPEALEKFREAFSLQPSSAQVANNIGFVYYRQGDYDGALEWYRKALVLDPQRAIAWANAGDIYEKTGRPGDAAEAYRKFLELAPKHSSAAYVRSRLAALESGG